MNNSVNELAEVLKQKMPGHVFCNEPMKKHTSFKIGGPADILVQPQDADALAQALAAARDCGVPVTILGNGSNVLVRDKGIRGLVIKIGNALKTFRQDGERLYFGAGYSLALASRKAWECGLSGMEFAVGIPGSIGGAVYMNAGAYNGEMKCVVENVRVMDMAGKAIELTAEDLQFGYRKTSLQQSGYIITKAATLLPKSALKCSRAIKTALKQGWTISAAGASASNRWNCRAQAACLNARPDILPVR